MTSKCNNEIITIYDKNDVVWWTGTNNDGLKIFISNYREKGVAIDDFRIFRGGNYVETIKCYMEREMMGSKKYRCEVAISGVEESTGIVYLTSNEYRAVKYATNTSNWKEAHISGCSVFFNIYCDELENPGINIDCTE